MAKLRNGSVYFYTEVRVDVDEVLGEISDEALLQELKDRKLEEKAKARIKLADPFEMLGEVLDCLHRGDAREALYLLDRIMHPKFPSIEYCEKEFEKLKSCAVGSPVLTHEKGPGHE